MTDGGLAVSCFIYTLITWFLGLCLGYLVGKLGKTCIHDLQKKSV